MPEVGRLMRIAREEAGTPRFPRLILGGLAAVALWHGAASAAGPQPPPAPVVAPTAAAAASPAPASPTPTPADESVALTDIAEKSQAALDTLNGVEAEPASEQEVTETRASVADYTERSGRVQSEVSGGGTVRSSLDDLRGLQAAGRKLEDTLTDRSAFLAQRAKSFETESAEVAQIDKRWRATDKTAREASAPKETLTLVQTVLNAAKEAQKRLKSRQTRLLELQSQLSTQIAAVRTAQGTVQQAISSAVKTLLVRDSAPLWSPEVQLGESKAIQNPSSFQTQWDDLLSYAGREWQNFAIHLGVIAVLVLGLLWLRHGLHKWTEEEPQLKRAAPILEVPVATAVALSFLAKGPIYSDAPNMLRAVLGGLLLGPTIIILRRLLDRHLYPFLYSLVLFFVLDQLRVATGGFPILNRWIFAGELVLAITAFVGLIFAQRAAAKSGAPAAPFWLVVVARFAILLLVVALAASILGYVQLGTLVGTAVIRSGYIGVALFALLRVLEGLTLIALRVRPLSASHIARLHRQEVQRQTSLYLGRAALLGWLLLTLDLFQLREALFTRIGFVLEKSLKIGSENISLGSVLGSIAAIWLSVVISRLLRFFLNEEVYERVTLSPGLPYAISTILNYLILLIGFLVALVILKFDLTKVTIVAGAFSVGLGFGLQNIINNFVSGIILLFERPVKVGDVIQIGDSIGEVRRIGIRASIIRTQQGSDIILPNGNLISNQVTNWTYTDQLRALEIPFTIASGPDLEHVMELLKATVAAQASSKGGPAPQAYITAVTATSVSLVVRAWTGHYEDWVIARSDLSVSILQALSRENIKLAA